MAKLTRWFAETAKPVRAGVYQTTFGNDLPGFSYWDGSAWHATAGTREAATPNVWGMTAFTQGKRWRGLAKEPK